MFTLEDLSDCVEKQHQSYKAAHQGVRNWAAKEGLVTCDGSTGD